MGQYDFTVSDSVRERICFALRESEKTDADSVEAQTLRLIKCAISDRDVIARSKGSCGGCEEQTLIELLETMIAQREVSVREYDAAGRIVDAEREREEIEVISAFLPKPLLGDALKEAVRSVVADLDAHKLKDMGKCMSTLRQRYPGRIECGPAGKAVRDVLR